MTLREAMEWASDLALVFNVVCFNGVAIDAMRVARRVGWRSLVGQFATFSIVLALFFDYFSIVYWDRRFNIIPGVDLFASMGLHWYWLPRAILGVAIIMFWRSMRRRG